MQPARRDPIVNALRQARRLSHATETPAQETAIMSTYRDRIEAGKALARALGQQGYADPVVLALPRGGVPIGAEVARALKAPLDLIMVRKIGLPSQPELAVAAVVDGDRPEIVRNEDVIRRSGIQANEIDRLAGAQLEEIARRKVLYVGDRSSVEITGRTAIVVDDGIATGATMRAALKAIGRKSPLRLILAVPVAPADTLALLSKEVDDVICLATPAPFYAVGAHYADFPQVSDEEVVRIMDDHAQTAGP